MYYIFLGLIFLITSHYYFSFVSQGEMASLFCKKAMVWGETLNFSTTEFAKGLRILNIVMTFVLTHGLTITLSSSLVLDFFFLLWKIFLKIFLHI